MVGKLVGYKEFQAWVMDNPYLSATINSSRLTVYFNSRQDRDENPKKDFKEKTIVFSLSAH